MTLFPPTPGRVLLLVGVLAFSLAACGRRGPLEAPPDPRAPRAAASQAAAPPPESDADDVVETPSDAVVPSAAPTPRKNAGRRGHVIPKDPFILDPLL